MLGHPCFLCPLFYELNSVGVHVNIQWLPSAPFFLGSYHHFLFFPSVMKTSCTISLQNVMCLFKKHKLCSSWREQGDIVCKGSHLSSTMGTLHPNLSPMAEPKFNTETSNLKFHILAAAQHHSTLLGRQQSQIKGALICPFFFCCITLTTPCLLIKLFP